MHSNTRASTRSNAPKPAKAAKQATQATPATRKLAENLADLKGAGRALVTFHSLGDVDAAASAIALKTVLSAAGVDANVRCVDGVNSQAKRVLTSLGFEVPKPLIGIDARAVVLVDVSNADLLGEWGPALSGFRGPLFVIDHHYHNKHIAAARGFAHVDPNASSTAEIVLEIARALNAKISAKTASLLLCAILADTAFFKSASNSTFEAACALIESGADYAECAALCRSKRDASETLAVLKCVGGAQIEKLGANAATPVLIVAFSCFPPASNT